MGLPYVVEGRLGRGGMGVVELAAAPDGRRVALKRLALGGSADALAGARARIRREAEILGRLDHPGIVELLDVVDDGDDVVLVMPWLQGGSLADRVARHGPLAPDEVDRLADHLLAALAAAHRAGVVHRDIKPANVLFDDDSRPLLADFGVASARDVTAGLTLAEGAVGTAGFVAPEQARGEPVTPAADVFGLGATLLWAATGRGPCGEGPADVLLWRAARNRVERSPRTLPPALRRRIDAMLQVRPDRRPTAAALAGGPAGTDPSVLSSRRPRPGRRPGRRRLGLVLAALVVAVAAGVALALLAADDGEPAAGRTLVSIPPTTAPPCLPGHADYDGDPANGCETAPDDLDGAELVDQLRPNLVPSDDVDEFPLEVGDGAQLLCDGELRLTLTAPAGVAARLTVLDERGEILAEVTSADGVAGSVRLREPSCGGDDSQTLIARVAPVGNDRTAEPYALARAGGW